LISEAEFLNTAFWWRNFKERENRHRGEDHIKIHVEKVG
jgi:hypothetical protein